jgi:hypothetical protein
MPGWIVAGLGVILVAGTVAAGVVAPGLPVRSTTAARAEAAPLVDRPGRQEWSWRPADELVDVVAAGAGVVVATQGGTLTALDGVSGSERWRYARPGAHVRALAATPDRSLVLASFAPGGGRDTGTDLLVVLDAMTGEPLHDSLQDDWISDLRALAPTDGVLPVFHRVAGSEPPAADDIDDHTIEALDLRTGERRWTWSTPRGCTSPFALPASGARVVLAPLRCDDLIGVVALDEATGKPRWKRTERRSTLDENAVDYHFGSSPDGSVVAVRVPALGMHVLLRAADGAELATGDADRYARADIGDSPVLEQEGGVEMVDPADGGRSPVDPAPCADRMADATVEGTYLALCGTVTDNRLTWQDGRVPPVTTAVDWGTGPAPVSMLLDSRPLLLVAAPGAIVAARTDAVVGFSAT